MCIYFRQLFFVFSFLQQTWHGPTCFSHVSCHVLFVYEIHPSKYSNFRIKKYSTNYQLTLQSWKYRENAMDVNIPGAWFLKVFFQKLLRNVFFVVFFGCYWVFINSFFDNFLERGPFYTTRSFQGILETKIGLDFVKKMGLSFVAISLKWLDNDFF